MKDTVITLGKYTIVKDDSMNFGLYVTKPKGSFRGKKGEGTTESLIGYFGYLDIAMSKIMHYELLNGSVEYLDAQSIIKAIRTVESNLNNAYHTRVQEIK